MERRAFIGAVAGGLLAAPLAAGAQTGKVARIGWLALTEVPNAPGRSAFRNGLRELGWIEGQNLVIELRSAGGKRDLLNGLAAELVRLNVDVLVGAATPETQALMQATKAIPIVFAASNDPAEARLVVSLGRPGGNVTGSSFAFEEGFSGKWVELLKQAVPKAARVAVLVLPAYPSHGPLLSKARLAARPL